MEQRQLGGESPAVPGLQFGVLGPLEVTAGGRAVAVGGFKRRSLLAVLLLSANRVVALDRLIDDLWGDQPPPQATNALQTYVSNLRAALEPARRPREAARVLCSRPPGYMLVVEPGALDAERFETLLRDGRALLKEGLPREGRDRLAGALALWRGAALAEFADQPFARAAAARLEELRAVCLEERIAADLALGEHAGAVGELQSLVAAEPLRERLWAHLVVALYRSGRQGDALTAYRDCRRTLDEELGIEPGPALKRLHEQVLQQAPELDWRGGEPARAELRSAPAAPEPAAAAATLIGRERPLARLEAAWASARARRGRLVLVTGEAGIGKTRLAEELGSGVQDAGARVAWGRCHEAEGAPVLWPWIQVQLALGGADMPADVGTALTRAGYDPSDLDLLLGRPVATAEPQGDPRGARFRLCQAACVALAALAELEPLLLVIDDLQWADAASLQLLEALAGAVRSAPIMVVATLRADELADEHPLAATLAALARRPVTSRIALSRLSSAEVGLLIAAEAGVQPPPALVETVHRRTEGNPFFLHELVQLLDAEGALHDPARAGQLPVPAGVRDVILRRLARLPEEANALLQTAAVLGYEFDLPLLEAVAGTAGDGLLDALEPALVSGLLVEREGIARYRFAHALVHETLYERHGPLRRARLHARVAEVLRERHGGDDARALELAHHSYRAAEVVGAAAALPAQLRAAEVALARLGYEQAEELLRRAITLVELLPRSEERDRTELWARSRLGMIAAAIRGVTAPETVAAWARARELATAAPAADEQLAVLFGSFLGAWVTSDVPGAAQLADELLAAARGGQDARLLLAGRFAQGMAALLGGRFLAARHDLGQAVIAADSLADPWLREALQGDPRVTARNMCALARAVCGEPARGQALAREALALARATGHRYSIVVALGTAAWPFVIARDHAAAGALCEEAVAAAIEHSFPMLALQCRPFVAWARALDGDAEAALPALEASLRDLQAAGLRTAASVYAFTAAEIQQRAGRADEALHTVDAALAAIRPGGERLYEAELHRLRGELLDPGAEAEASIERALATAAQQGAALLERRARASLDALRERVQAT